MELEGETEIVFRDKSNDVSLVSVPRRNNSRQRQGLTSGRHSLVWDELLLGLISQYWNFDFHFNKFNLRPQTRKQLISPI